MEEVKKTKAEVLEALLALEVTKRGIKVIKHGEPISKALEGVTTVIALNKLDPLYVERTKAYHPKTTLFYVASNQFLGMHFLDTLAEHIPNACTVNRPALSLKLVGA